MISGGTSMFSGFPTRLENDIRRIYKNKVRKGQEIKIKIKIRVYYYKEN
jgi:actin-related protein